MKKVLCVLLFGFVTSQTVAAELIATRDLAIEREVRLKNAATVSTQSICLQDIVEDSWIQIRCRHSQARCCMWNLQGNLSRKLSRGQLQQDVGNIGITGFVLRLVGPEQVEITQTHRELTIAEIEARLKKRIAARFGESLENIKLASLRISNPIYVALGRENDWELELPLQIRSSASVKILSTGFSPQPLGWITAQVVRESDAYVAKRTVRPGDTIKEEDFELKPINVLSVGEDAFMHGELPVGSRAQRSILRGGPLTLSAVEKKNEVRIGETVTLILKSDNLSITTKGIAQGSGSQGDTISVQVVKYNRTFRGKLVGGKQVEVWL